MSLLQPSLHSRLIHLEEILENNSLEEICFVLNDLLSSKFTEKVWKTSLIEGICHSLQQAHVESTETLDIFLNCLVEASIKFKSIEKSVLILETLIESSTFLWSNEDYERTISTFTKVKPVLLQNLEYLYFNDRSNKPNYSHVLRKLVIALKSKPTLLDTLFLISDITTLSITALVIISILTKKLSYENIEYRTAIIGEYIKKIISAKTAVNHVILAGFAPFISSLSQTEWEQHFEGNISRMIKKSPETASSLVSTVLSQVHVDLSNVTKEGMAASGLRLIKTASEDCQLAGSQILSNLAHKTTNPDAFAVLVTVLVEGLQGKSGSISLSNQRGAATLSLLECAKAILGNSSIATDIVVCDTIKLIGACFEREADASCLQAYSGCLGHWLACLSSPNKESFSFLGTALKKSKEVCQMMLAAVMIALQLNEDVLSVIKPLETSLIDLVKEANKRPQQVQIEGILSLALLLKLSIQDAKVLDAISTAKLWAVISSPATSFLYSKQNIQLFKDFGLKNSEHNSRFFQNAVLSASFSIFSIVAAYYPEHLKPALPPVNTSLAYTIDLSDGALINQHGPYQVILHILLQEDNSIRSILAGHLNVLFQHIPTFSRGLAVVLRQYLHRLSSIREVQSAQDSSTFKKTSTDESVSVEVKRGVSSAKYIEAIKLILSKLPSLDKDTSANLMLSVCSPLVSEGNLKIAAALWKSNLIQSQLSVMTGDAAEWSSMLLTCVYSDSADLRSSAHLCCLLLHRFSGKFGENLLKTSIIRALLNNLNKDQFLGISERDIDLFMNPTAQESVVQEVSLADIKITNEDRKKTSARSSRTKGAAFGADLIEDEDWAEQIKKEKAKKLLETMKSESVEQQSKRALEVQEVKGRLDGLVNKVGGSLHAIRFLTQYCPELVCKSQELIGALVACLEFKLVTDIAYKCIEQLAATLDSNILPIGRDIAAALRIIYTTPSLRATHKKGDSPIGILEGPLVRSIRGLQAVVGRGVRLDAFSTHLVFLILSFLLCLPSLPAGCELAFMIFDHCWPSPRDDARCRSEELKAANLYKTLRPLLKDFLYTCLHVLCRFRVEPSPETVLLRLANSVSLNAHEWAVIVSETGLLAAEKNVRVGCLKVILEARLENRVECHRLEIETAVWLAMSYEDEAVQTLAADCWSNLSAILSPEHIDNLFRLLSHPQEHVRIAAGRGIGRAVSTINDDSLRSDILTRLVDLFTACTVKKLKPIVEKEKAGKGPAIPMLAPKKIEEDVKWPTRKAIGAALLTACLQKALKGNDVEKHLLFFLQLGVVDSNEDVRSVMLSGGLALIENYGEEFNAQIYATVDSILNLKESKDEDHELFDRRHEAAVVFLGAIGRHLNQNDPNILRIALSLMEALNTPSEKVQRAVADCLSPIIAVIKTSEKAPEFLEMLMTRLQNAETYGERRGAAFGLSAVVKGLGISSLKQYDIVGRLKIVCTEGTVPAREGSLFGFECLSDRLGLLFEPYVIPIVPILLKSFSHTSDHVREAAHMAAKVIMGKLSAHGVKQVLNPILASLPEETQWKSRQESIRLLGSMAHLSPKSLATSLPQIIPRLVEAANDVHPKVKESARTAMSDITSVIKNPEVAELSPILLEAIADPASKTKNALDVLLACEFMHSIDAPSLALLVPILSRALRDRSADLKRKSSAIMGNITSMLSEPKIICPYMSQILPGLKSSLLDPIPDVRTMSAKAIGSLIGGVGEDECEDLVPWLLATLKSDESPVERSGAAQGLAEVAVVLGRVRLKSLLTEVITYKNSPKSAAREGLLWLLSFLPSVLSESFAEHIGTTLPVILVGLSDSSESVREVAMRSGRIMVQSMGINHSLELLPSLRLGLFDEDSRIRHSSVTLLGELLYLVGDAKPMGSMQETDEDDEGGGFESTARVAQTIRSTLGEKNTNEVLASLYTVRSDTAIGVRQIALQVWKSIVSNTPRTLVEIMPTLVRILVENLSSSVYDLKVMSSRCLGETVKKLGNKVLTILVPSLREGLDHGDEHTRSGICLGLSEILSSLTKVQVESHLDSLIPSLQKALCDSDVGVRSQAAYAFQTLAKCIGPRAIDEIVPALVDQLGSSEDGRDELALLGLKEVVQLKPRDLLEYLLPRLLKSPIQMVSAKALGTIAQVTGQYLHHHFTLIVSQLVLELSNLSSVSKEDVDFERFEAVQACAADIMGSVTSTGINFLIIELGKQVENENDALKRRWGCWLFEQFIQRTTADFSEYVSIILKYLLSRVADRDRDVLVSLLGALTALSSMYPVEEYVEHIDFISSCISSAASDARFRTASTAKVSSTSGAYVLPLFTVPKSLDAFMPMLLFALTNGSTLVRESAATVIGEMIVVCDIEVLKPFLIKVTGPLIRVVGDRFPSSVKAAILDTLCVLLERGGASLKPFAPQLQTTFVKSLNDPMKQVRVCASTALNKLITLNLTARVDPLITELATIISQTDSSAIKSSVLDALASVLKHSGSKATLSILIEKVEPEIVRNLDEDDETVRQSAVACLGQAAVSFPSEHLIELVNGLLARKSDTNSAVIGRVLGVSSILCNIDSYSDMLRSTVFDTIRACFVHDEPAVRAAACSAIRLLLKAEPYLASSAVDAFSKDICKATKDSSGDVRYNAIVVIKESAKLHLEASKKFIGDFMPPLIATIQEALNIKAKYAAERAMYYLLQGGSNPAIINAYAVKASGEDVAFVKDYSRRVLSKQPENSDDEGGHW